MFEIAVIVIIFLLIIVFAIILLNTAENGETMDPIEPNTFPFPIYIINLERKPERYRYIKQQLDNLGIKNYQQWRATDGFKVSDQEMLNDGVNQKLISDGRGLSGCASSHIRIWKHIAENKLDWTLILEDDVHFHPDFVKLFHQYWKKTPIQSKIIYPGFFESPLLSKQIVIRQNVLCLHGYMINSKSAQYLLDNLLPMDQPIDIVVANHFAWRDGSYVFNSWIDINGIVANDYKKNNGDKCMFNGIIYQNRQEYGRTIYHENTTFNNHQ